MLPIKLLKKRQSFVTQAVCTLYQNGNSQALEHIYIKLIS